MKGIKAGMIINYDVNGNMTRDENKGIQSGGITYNHLNLPKEIRINGSANNRIAYIYDATGTKLAKKVTESGSLTTTEYAGGFVYKKHGTQASVLDFFSTPEGYVSHENGSYQYVYQYKDHLGNVRLSYSDANHNGSINPDTELKEEHNCYPFGLRHEGYNTTPDIYLGSDIADNYLYNGVELEESLDLNLYEMEMRQYDPAIGRFTGIDPIAHHSMSTYTAFDNNPVFWSDPSGADAESFIRDLFNRSGSGETIWTNNNDGTFSSSDGQTADCDDCPDPPKWLTGLVNWFNGEGEYDGSGWGHGLRSYIKDKLGVDNNSASIIETGILSILQARKIELQGNALQKVRIDPDIVAYEASIVLDAIANEDFKRKAFSFSTQRSVQFGGDRASDDMWEQLKDPLNPAYADTWKVAMNELTWLVRSTTVKSTVNVGANGEITISHSFSDVFDLRPSAGRSSAYNTATEVLGFLYHDVLGGNDQMRVNASWSNTIQK